MKTKLLDAEEILAEALANLCGRWGNVGGRLTVTTRRILFESDFLSGGRVTEIPLDDVADVYPYNNLWIIPNGMTIETHDGVCRRFVVWGRQQLIDLIHVYKSRIVRGEREEPPAPLPRPDAPAGPAIQPGSSVEGTARPKQT